MHTCNAALEMKTATMYYRGVNEPTTHNGHIHLSRASGYPRTPQKACAGQEVRLDIPVLGGAVQCYLIKGLASSALAFYTSAENRYCVLLRVLRVLEGSRIHSTPVVKGFQC